MDIQSFNALYVVILGWPNKTYCHTNCKMSDRRANLTAAWDLDPMGAEIFAGDLLKAKYEQATPEQENISLANSKSLDTKTKMSFVIVSVKCTTLHCSIDSM